MKTYDIGRLFFVPLRSDMPTRTSRTHTWEVDGKYRFGPTFVWRPFLSIPWALGIGWWHDSEVEDIDLERKQHYEMERANAEYDAYVAVNGAVERWKWDAARHHIAAQGLDPDEEMEMMQMLGVFE